MCNIYIDYKLVTDHANDTFVSTKNFITLGDINYIYPRPPTVDDHK